MTATPLTIKPEDTHVSTFANLPDDLNPDFIFSTTATRLLVDMVNGKIDPIELAKKQLQNRGLNPNTGEWAGFKNK